MAEQKNEVLTALPSLRAADLDAARSKSSNNLLEYCSPQDRQI